VESLRETIAKLVDNREWQEKLGAAAREFVVDNFALATQINKEIKIYESLV